MKSIFTITALHIDNRTDWASSDSDSNRCFGYYFTLDLALDSVKCNRGSMDEAGFYQLLVIEEIKEGIHAEAKQIAWFEWRDKYWAELPRESWEITRPVNITNWALG